MFACQKNIIFIWYFSLLKYQYFCNIFDTKFTPNGPKVSATATTARFRRRSRSHSCGNNVYEQIVPNWVLFDDDYVFYNVLSTYKKQQQHIVLTHFYRTTSLYIYAAFEPKWVQHESQFVNIGPTLSGNHSVYRFLTIDRTTITICYIIFEPNMVQISSKSDHISQTYVFL